MTGAIDFTDGYHSDYSFVRCQISAHISAMDGIVNIDKGRASGAPLSRIARLRLALAQYRQLQLIAQRPSENLLRDVGLSRDEASDRLKTGPLLGWVLRR